MSCSTPTHAAEAAVLVDCALARQRLHALAGRLERQGSRAILERAQTLARLSRAPSHHVERHRARLHQHTRELRAVTRRGLGDRRRTLGAHLATLARRTEAAQTAADRSAARTRGAAAALDRAAAATLDRRSRDLERLERVLAAHDPQRTLDRGYVLVETPDGEPVLDAATAGARPVLVLRLRDGRLRVRPDAAAPPDADLPLFEP